MEWKKLTCAEVSNWEVELPSNFSGGKEVTFRCPSQKANIPQLLKFLESVYGVDYKVGQPEPVAYHKEEKVGRIHVKLPLLEGKNLKFITENFGPEDWPFIRTCRNAEYSTYEELLLQNVVTKLLDDPTENPGELGNILLEYQELMKFAGLLKHSTGKLDMQTFKAHREFLKQGLSDKLKFPKDSLVKWIQSVVGAEIDGKYGLETWLLVKPHTIGEGNRFLAPAIEMSAEKLLETFIPYKALGSKSREIVALMLKEAGMRERAYQMKGELPPHMWDTARDIELAADRAAVEWNALLQKQIKEEIAKFNEFVKANRDKREKQEEIERRAQEIFQKAFSDINWYGSEQLFGETITSIIKALNPESPEELLLEYALAAVSAGVFAYVRQAIKLRHMRKTAFGIFQKKTTRLLEIAEKRGFPVGRMAQGRTGELAARWELTRKYGFRIVRSGQHKVGGAWRGIDTFAIRGRGKTARLALCPCQFLDKGPVQPRKLTALGLGKGGRRVFEKNAKILMKRIKSALKGADRATREAVLKQLTEETFDIFMCVRDKSQVGKDVIQALRRAFPQAGKIEALPYGSLLAP